MRMITLASACAGCLAAGAVVSTNNDSAVSVPATNLPPVVVEASRLGKTAMEMPQFVETVTRDEIAVSGARNTTDLLEHETGVFIRRLGGENPALAQVAMRGYGENSFGRVLVSVDGESLNNPDMSTPNLSRIPIDAIERVEILHGPQTVLHGDNSSAGMVNFVTDRSDYSRKTSLEVSGGSWNTISTRASTRGGDESAQVAYWASADYTHSDGYRENSGYDIYNLSGGVRKDWSNGSYAKLSFFYSDSDYELPGALSKYEWKHHPRSSQTPNDNARLSTYGLNFNGYGVMNDENALKLLATASRRKMKAYYFNDLGGGYTYDERLDSDIYTYSFSPQYINTTRIGKFDNEFTLGTDLRYDTLLGHDDFTGSYESHSKPDQDRFRAGIFAHDEFFFTDEISVVLGSRLERSMAHNELAGRNSRNDNLVAYEAALNYRPVEEAKLFARWSRFYRNPFLDETPWYYNSLGVYSPKEILAPERGYSVDVGGDWKFMKEFSVGGALFAGETKNEIFYDAGQGSNVNSPDSVRREGLELHTGWSREKVAAVNLRYALTHSEFTEGVYDEKRIPLVPMHQISLDGRYYLWDEFFVRGAYRYISNQVSCSDFANAYEKIPAFGLFSLGCRYSPTWKWTKGFTFDFNVDNLFNKNYCAYSTYGSSYYPGAGRSYTFTIGYEF